jgi:hypothetical protein
MATPPRRPGVSRPVGDLTVLGRDPASPISSVDTLQPRTPIDFGTAIGIDLRAPPPLLLLPLRLEYRVVETNVPITIAGNVSAAFRDGATISDASPGVAGNSGAVSRDRAATSDAPSARSASERPAARTSDRRTNAPPWRLGAARATFQRREIWFRWFPDDDFSLRGIAPPSEQENEALARFEAACAGKPWHAVDDAAVISAWQVLSREVAPERAMHLIRHRGEPGDPNFLDAAGKMTLLPEKVALFALDAAGAATLLGESRAIDPALRYSIAALRPGGWLTDFDVALNAGMGLRLVDNAAVSRALAASWIVAVGLSKEDGAAAMTTLTNDAVANGAFAFLPQDTPTNNAPHAPTPYKTPRADLLGFLRSAVEAEKGVLASPLTQSAELFAEALGLDVAAVATAPNSGDLAFEDARAMVRVIGPALIDSAVDHVTALNGIDEEEVVDLFAEAIIARGPLPPIRVGKNPYGILPIIKLGGLSALASDTDRQQRIEAFLRDFSMIVIQQSQAAAAAVPVLEPEDPDGAAKLEAILKQNPVSRRLSVSTVGQSGFKALGCAYVTNKTHPVSVYLRDLARKPIASLPDPDASDTTFPLLYRLARLSLSKSVVLTTVMAEPTVGITKVTLRDQWTAQQNDKVDVALARITPLSVASLASRQPAAIGVVAGRVLQIASQRFLDALQRLEAIASEADGVAKLETLLMETIDLFQHRIDAWATGIAYRRLVKRRRAGGRGLSGGYWGMIGRLRPRTVTGTGGYLQAPSLQQAVTAAVLRSAYLRHPGSGAFAIGLDSARVRRGLQLLEMLQAGLSPGEALGYLAERRLHDTHQDILIFQLRDLFPLRDPRDDAAIETRLANGLAFLRADIAALVHPAQVAPLHALQDHLRGHFDALADIVMAEAAHLRGMGQADAANAWLQVLSGDTIPGLPSVLRTRRNGHGSSHRVAVLIPPATPREEAAPRAIAEPALAALAVEWLGGFGAAFVDVSIGGAGETVVRKYMLAADLGLTPIDLLVGGESEILLRARHRLVSLWRDDAATRAALGPLPDRDIVSFINRIRPTTVDLDVGSPSARKLLAVAADLRRAVAQGRMLEPGDLSAAADPAKPLTDAIERDLIAGSTAELAVRAKILGNRLSIDSGVLVGAVGPAVAAARNHRRLIDGGAADAALSLSLSALASLLRTLDAALLGVSRHAEPGALRLVGRAEIAADPEDFDRGLATLVARLKAKTAALSSAVSAAALQPPTASAARAQRDGLVAALKAALDGDAQPVLPPLTRVVATTPLLKPNPPKVAPALADWRPVRARIDQIATLFGGDPWRAHASADAATGADDPEADLRTEDVAPRARLYGTWISASNPANAATFAGFVADEWAEQRPSRMQQTGLAINYDSPQSEPPQALLLCEPAGPHAPTWSPQLAAEMVSETIRLMKTRALSTQERPLPGPLFPFANQVPFKPLPARPAAARIPVALILASAAVAARGNAAFVVDPNAVNVGITGGGLVEISGFSKVKE